MNNKLQTRTLSSETILWGALVLVAAAVRLFDLGGAALSNAEAAQALAAHLTATGWQGSTAFVAAQPLPLLYHANTLLFSLFEAGNGLARLVPAVTGVGLALAPLLLRRQLGRWGALGAGGLLALSPTATLFSRTVDGAVPAAFGVLLLVGCAARFLETRRPRAIVGAGLGLAVALTAGAEAWGLLLGLVLALTAALWMWRDETDAAWLALRPALPKGLLAAGLGVLALGSGLLLDLPGLAATVNLLLDWLARFGAPAGVSATSATLLLAYEPLIVAAGLAGAVLAVWKRHTLGILVTFWAVVGAAQVLLMRHPLPGSLLCLLPPLALLGGIAIESLVQALQTHGHWGNEGLYLPITLVIWLHSGLNLARYANTADDVHWLLAWVTLLLQVLLAAAFGFAVSAPETEDEDVRQMVRRGAFATLRAGGVSLGIALLFVTFSTMWGASHFRANDPRELLLLEPPAAELDTLADVVYHVASHSVGAPPALALTFVGQPDPAVFWALRDFDPRVEPAQSAALAASPQVMVASSEAPLPPGYFGETFTVQRSWTPQWSDRLDTLRWLLYRQSSNAAVPTVRVAVWVRNDLATAPLPTD
ncbi:MAG: hypothetical protein JXD18_12330 [Anaerolineae bacterium]|nr:hypothetical protein [Anaerolineae bacterium]